MIARASSLVGGARSARLGRVRFYRAIAVALMVIVVDAAPLGAAPRSAGASATPVAQVASVSPWDQVVRVLAMRDYNTRVVLLGTMLLGVVAGVVGTFMLLRKRALVGDVVSHASLPGIGIAFIVMEVISPGSGRSLPALLSGALAAGVCGMIGVVAIRNTTRIKEDAALAVVLSVFFGLGVVLFTVIQNIPSGSVAGLHAFILGKAASMVAADVWVILVAALVVLAACALMFKEFALLCFDGDYADAQGWPTWALDLALMGLVAVVTVIGLQSVGLLLVVAMLIIPAAAARFWSDRLLWMAVAAASLGGLSSVTGVLASALYPRLAAGAVIVLAQFAFFTLSMMFSPRRGVVRHALDHRRLRRQVGRAHLLRACYEQIESATADPNAPIGVAIERLLAMRSWTASELRRWIADAQRAGMIRRGTGATLTLTDTGLEQAASVARNHRLWELYLITYADVAPGGVDRYADRIEHVAEPEIVERLERLLAAQYASVGRVPPSPHALDALTEIDEPAAAFTDTKPRHGAQ